MCIGFGTEHVPDVGLKLSELTSVWLYSRHAKVSIEGKIDANHVVSYDLSVSKNKSFIYFFYLFIYSGRNCTSARVHLFFRCCMFTGLTRRCSYSLQLKHRQTCVLVSRRSRYVFIKIERCNDWSERTGETVWVMHLLCWLYQKLRWRRVVLILQQIAFYNNYKIKKLQRDD